MCTFIKKKLIKNTRKAFDDSKQEPKDLRINIF